MKDDFLYKNRPPVRPEYATQLYQRLSQQYPDSRLEKKGAFNKMNGRRMWIYALVTLALVVAAVFATAGEVRASVIDLIKSVAGFNVVESNESPLKDFGENAATADKTALPGQAQDTPMAVSTVIIPTLSLDDVLQNPPFEFSLPQYVPAGFTLTGDAAVANSGEWVSLTFANLDDAEIWMLVEESYTGYQLPAGIDSTEEVSVKGQPALLIRGGWNASHQWDERYGMELHWQQNGRYYRLIWSQRAPATRALQPISGDLEQVERELLQMAESVS